MPSWLKTAFVYGAGFMTAATLATACDPSYGITSFRCDPSSPDCPTKYGTGGNYVCCSDDPASLDLADIDGQALPSYAGGSGIPLFSGPQNSLSSSGFCIDLSQVPIDAAIPDPGSGMGCPLPCNPTWSNEDITAVCGGGTSCCATAEVEDLDCAFDPSLGDAGCWRPVTGVDITGLGGVDASDWRASAHATHQDPGGSGCQQFVVQAAANISGAELTPEEVQFACFRQLTVANQRGFCQGAMDCPLANPAYRDACELKNDQQGLAGCG